MQSILNFTEEGGKVNKLIIIGNLTKNPVTATTPNGVMKCMFNVAVQRTHADADGVRKADFIPITCWRTLAENCAKYLTKGRRVAICAHVQTDSYTNEKGETRFIINFIADDVEFQPSGGGNGNAQQAASPQAAAAPGVPAGGGFVQVDEEELPF